MEILALQVDQVLGGLDLQRNIGVALAPARHARQQPALGKRRQHAYPQAQCAFLCRRGGGQGAFVQLRQGRRDAAQQGGARRIQAQAAALPVEQGKTQLFFQMADLLADGAMRQVQAFAGGAQVLQLRDDAKHRQRIQR